MELIDGQIVQELFKVDVVSNVENDGLIFLIQKLKKEIGLH